MNAWRAPQRVGFRHPANQLRTSGGTPGRPSRRRLFHVQKSRKPRRCQARTVSGLTITMTSAIRPRPSTARPTTCGRPADPQSSRPRSVHHVELMAQRQDLELQGSPSAERHAEGQEKRDNDGTHRRTLSAEGDKINAFKKNELLIGTGYQFEILIAIRQRRIATIPQMPSTSPNGHAPCRNP